MSEPTKADQWIDAHVPIPSSSTVCTCDTAFKYMREAFAAGQAEAAGRFLDEREELLHLCHNAPRAVEMDTRKLEIAIRKLVDFAWEVVR